MRTARWAAMAGGVFFAAFVLMWMVDASLPPRANLVDPVLWLGALILGVLGLTGLARHRGADTRTVVRGVLVGLLGFVVLLLALYLVVFAGMGID